MSEWNALSAANADVSSREFLQNVRDWLSSELQSAKNDLRKISKLQWLANHFNKLAKERGKVDLLVFPAATS